MQPTLSRLSTCKVIYVYLLLKLIICSQKHITYLFINHLYYYLHYLFILYISIRFALSRLLFFLYIEYKMYDSSKLERWTVHSNVWSGLNSTKDTIKHKAYMLTYLCIILIVIKQISNWIL